MEKSQTFETLPLFILVRGIMMAPQGDTRIHYMRIRDLVERLDTVQNGVRALLFLQVGTERNEEFASQLQDSTIFQTIYFRSLLSAPS